MFRGPLAGATNHCRVLPIMVGTEPLQLEFFGLALGGCDVIVGTQWLHTPGPILWDFALDIHGCRISWQGKPGRFATSCQAAQTDDLQTHLLAEFGNLFLEPTGLPSSRAHDHHIHLVADAQSVNFKRTNWNDNVHICFAKGSFASARPYFKCRSSWLGSMMAPGGFA